MGILVVGGTTRLGPRGQNVRGMSIFSVNLRSQVVKKGTETIYLDTHELSRNLLMMGEVLTKCAECVCASLAKKLLNLL